MAMEAITLALKKRDMKVKAKHLRAKGLVPGVIYGHGIENRQVTADYNTFAKAFKKAGESTLIDLEVEGDGTVKALVKDWQIEPLRSTYTHVDFYQVNLKEKLKVEIVLNFVGESRAVKEQGGSLVKSLDRIRVECLPTDLVHEIDVDVTDLASFDQMIRVKDLKIPAGIEVLENPDAVIASIEAPMTEEELKALEGPVAAAATDVTAIKTEAEEKKAAEDAKKAAEAAAAE